MESDIEMVLKRCAVKKWATKEVSKIRLTEATNKAWAPLLFYLASMLDLLKGWTELEPQEFLFTFSNMIQMPPNYPY
jgi:hypothetical protein